MSASFDMPPHLLLVPRVCTTSLAHTFLVPYHDLCLHLLQPHGSNGITDLLGVGMWPSLCAPPTLSQPQTPRHYSSQPSVECRSSPDLITSRVASQHVALGSPWISLNFRIQQLGL